mmetsp:Transcript_11589/g.18201  ORF Transcript_11589/g.18201 Transcript_11589/m.18201 type:complete len:270 (+) Transcript_11589:158-967(+)
MARLGAVLAVVAAASAPLAQAFVLQPLSSSTLSHPGLHDAGVGNLCLAQLQRPRAWSEKSVRNQKDPKSGGEEETGPLLKAAWVAAEALGKAAAALKGDGGAEESALGDDDIEGVVPREELMKRLEKEYENEYFISGDMDLSLYEEDCLFADPFASFRGRERFKTNLDNLGLFVSDSECRLLSLTADPEDSNAITSRVMVKLELRLPWKPVLAWPWGVKHVIDERSGRISQHLESWEIAAGDGIAQVFRPGPPSGLRKSKTDIEQKGSE